MKKRRRPEDSEQGNICQLTSSLGGKPWVLGTRRRRGDYPGTMQTAGVADLWLTLPVSRSTGAPAVGLWWEAKAPGERRTPDQVGFADWCAATNTPYGWGTFDDFIAWLIIRGYCTPMMFPHYRLPPGPGFTR